MSRSRTLAVAALLAALPLALELGARAAARARGEPYSTGAVRERMARLTRATETVRDPDPAGRGLVPHPFFAWEELPIQDRLHAEAEYFASPEAEKAYDVLIVGSSGALRFAAEGADVLARVLATRRGFRGRPVRATTLARAGCKQPQQLNLVNYALMLGWRPDLVLNVDGVTDLVEGVANAEAGAHPLQPAASIFAPLDLSAGSDRDTMGLWVEAHRHRTELLDLLALSRSLGLERSALLGALVLDRLERGAADVQSALAAYDAAAAARPRVAVTGPPVPQSEAVRLRAIADGWQRSSRALHAVCAARGIDYVHLLEPAAERMGPAVRRGYGLLLERGEELRAEGVAFADASRLVHARKQARAVVLALLGKD